MQAVLNSWKEIAKYFDRGVRTTQRWEHDLQLPVHRIRNSNRGPVYAFPPELKLWLLANAAATQHTLPLTRNHSNQYMQKLRRLRQAQSELRQAQSRLIQDQLEKKATLKHTVNRMIEIAELRASEKSAPRKSPATARLRNSAAA